MKRMYLSALLAGTASVGAEAAVYNFNVNYQGGGIVTLAEGSDDSLSVIFADGDSFTYRLTAIGGGEWTVLSGQSVFPRFAFVGSFISSNLSYTLRLNQNGSPVFSNTDTVSTCCGHIGANTLALPTGLVFDQWELAVAITTTGAASPAGSLLPWRA